MIPAIDRQRAYLYLTRRRAGRLEVAVFRHPEYETMKLGIQVPGGTIEAHETPETGALREALEESGLQDFSSVRVLGTDIWYGAHDAQTRRRYFFQLVVPTDMPDIWKHTVTDGELDKGMVFDYHWLGCDEAKAILSHMGDYLGRLE
jgi:8-oxo-dGTP pyrophosphatase MutT (NUDIX family)